MPAVGEIWHQSQRYTNPDTGELLGKYLLVLAIKPDGDIVYRLLTSQPYSRPTVPECDKDGERPSYYLGIPQPTGLLKKPSWLDLRATEFQGDLDFDKLHFQKLVTNGICTPTHTISTQAMCPILRCVAYANDTTKSQTKVIMDMIATLKCP